MTERLAFDGLPLPNAPERIETERLILRPFADDDAAILLDALNESRNEWTPWLRWVSDCTTIEQAESYCIHRRVYWQRHDELTYAIWHRHSGRFLGAVDLHELNWFFLEFQVGYYLRTSATDLGYMAEAVQAMIRMAFSDLRSQKLEIWVDPANTRGIRVAERARFASRGTWSFQDLDVDDEPRDMARYLLTP
jgi:RimJ/RimL family protein N-acetyltransferase